MVTSFDNDDVGYLTWVGHHPEGFVTNRNANPNPDYVTVHRANCRTISGTPASGKAWTTLYKKVCGDTLTELESWAMREVNTESQRYGFCHP